MAGWKWLAVAALVVVLAMSIPTESYASSRREKAGPYEADFADVEQRYQLPRGLLARIAYQESRFNPNAYNAGSGAAGMMQIVPRWHPGIDPRDPAQAIEEAGRYLREMYDKFGTWRLAIAAYNWGPGNLQKYGWDARPDETRTYVADVIRDVPGIV